MFDSCIWCHTTRRARSIMKTVHAVQVPQILEPAVQIGIAGEVAAKLVQAYAELRQLDYLLASLRAALRDSGTGGAAIVKSDVFQTTLRKARDTKVSSLCAIWLSIGG